MKKTTILFDMDGTLIASAEGILKGVRAALSKMKIENLEEAELLKFIGPPLEQSFQDFYHFNPAQVKEASAYYHDYYDHKGLYENRLYPGVLELLQELKDAGFRLIITTSKMERVARRIAEHYDIADNFELIAGSNLEQGRSKKVEVIAYALSSQGILPAEAVMIGDRSFDVIGARENGVSTIGVLYGYGKRQELEHAGAKEIVETVAVLKTLLLGKNAIK